MKFLLLLPLNSRFKMFFIFKEYLRFLRKSSNQHGVHSPFVYNFVTKCLYVKPTRFQKDFFFKNNSELLKSNEKIQIRDFGAGSKVFKNNYRSVSKIAKVASIKKKYGLLLMRLIPYLKVSSCLEIGTSVGIATSCMGGADSSVKVITLEGCKNTANIAKQQFVFLGLKNIDVEVGEFDKTLPKILKNNNFDMIFFDGNHTFDATVKYFNEALKSKHNDSIFIFDDIHWNSEMCRAWEEIKAHDEVTVTIDTFQWGMVFFRKEQRKEHFTIRI